MDTGYDKIEKSIREGSKQYERGEIISSFRTYVHLNARLRNLSEMVNGLLEKTEYLDMSEFSTMIEGEMIEGDSIIDTLTELKRKMDNDLNVVGDMLSTTNNHLERIAEECLAYRWANPEDPEIMKDLVMGYGRYIMHKGTVAYIHPFDHSQGHFTPSDDGYVRTIFRHSIDEVIEPADLGDTIIIESGLSEDPLTLFTIVNTKYMHAIDMVRDNGYCISADMRDKLPIGF